MKNVRMFSIFLGLLVVSCLLVSCFSSENPSAQRAKRARRAQGPIVIGAASPWSETHSFLEQGIKLAVAEVNASGGVLGRNLEVIFADDKATVSTGQLVAQQFADNPDMVAVIGHTNSYISIPVSIIYEYYGLLMLSPLSTSPRFTERKFKLVFRNIPDDVAYGLEMAHLCKKRHLKRAIIYHIDNEYGTGLANAFENECRTTDVDIVDRASYDSVSGMKVFKFQLEFWQRNYEFDTLFLAAEMPDAAEIVVYARKLGINATIIGGDYFDNLGFIKSAGEAAEGVIVPSVFQPDNPLPSVVSFVKNFKKKYGQTPGYAAEQGYDAVKVLVQAIEAVKTTEPLKVAEIMRSGKEWRGVIDDYSFNDKGNVEGRKIFFKVVKNGDFVLLSD
ncbi:MAG: ABC transporter substrate-binding protein [Deltaproteobacteria bacterium]|nr:ABC transporter substrate-binding protein [Deltaproteobacteria bacterium]